MINVAHMYSLRAVDLQFDVDVCRTWRYMTNHAACSDVYYFYDVFRSYPKKLASIRRSCRAFFMELVSTLCFGRHETPEPELITMLMNTIFMEGEQEGELGTREFSPYKEAKRDGIPVIRSFLLQLLLEHE